MSKWELPKEPQFYNWESPITKIYGDIYNEIIRKDEENCTFAIEQAIGYKVDKNELIKALQYDREQYDKGYKDGVRETFIEELEKIKAEIQKEADYLKQQKDYAKAYGMEIAIEYIDKHISELKGENK